MHVICFAMLRCVELCYVVLLCSYVMFSYVTSTFISLLATGKEDLGFVLQRNLSCCFVH